MGILVVGFIFIFILSSNSTTKTVKASYSNKIRIDNVQEVEYTNIIDFDGYKIYYAYNDTFHFLYIITPFNFTSEIIEIRDQKDELICIFSPTFQPPSFIGKVKFANNTLEIELNRAIIEGNDFAIKIGDYPHLFILKVDPAPKSTTPQYIYHEEEDEKDEKDGQQGPDLASYINDPLVPWMLLITLLPFAVVTSIVFHSYSSTYRTNYKNKKGRHRAVGRRLYEEPSNILPGFQEVYFKKRGLKRVFSKREYINEVTPTYLKLPLLHYYADIVYREVNASEVEGIIIYEQEPADSFGNKLKYYILLVLSIIFPLISFVKRLRTNVEYKIKTEKEDDETRPKLTLITRKPKGTYHQKEKLDENNEPIPVVLKKIPIIQHQLTFDRIEHVCDVEYDIMETTEAGEENVHKTEKEKLIYYTKDLERNEKVIKDSIETYNYAAKVVPGYDMERAILEQDTIDNARSIADLKVAKITKDYMEQGKVLNITREQLDASNRTFETRVKDEYYKVVQIITSDKSTFRDMMADAFRYYNISGNMDDAIQIALKNHFKRIESKQYGQLEFKLEAEKAKRELLEKQIKKSKKQKLFPSPIEEDEIDEDEID